MTAALLVMMAALAAAQEPTLTPVEETRAWQARRNESLSDNSGWLALAGLFPLSDGQFSLGAGTTSASSPPRRVGRLTPALAASCGRTRRTQMVTPSSTSTAPTTHHAPSHRSPPVHCRRQEIDSTRR